MPTTGSKSKSPTPSSEPRAPTHRSHSSKTPSDSKSRSKSASKSRSKSASKSGSKSGSNVKSKSQSGSKNGTGNGNGEEAGISGYGSGYGSPQEAGEGELGSAGYGPGSGGYGEGSKASKQYDEEAPPSRDSPPEKRTKEGSFDSSLFPYAVAGFAVGLVIGAVLVLFFGFCCCVFTDWRSVWRDRKKRAFLGGFATGVLIAIIVYVALFIALLVRD